MEKNFNSSTSPQGFNSHLYLDEQEKEDLQNMVAELKELCDELDPYSPISHKHQVLLEKHNITELNDPFKITNQLIFKLENALEKLQKNSESK